MNDSTGREDRLEAAFALWHESHDLDEVRRRFPDVAGEVAALAGVRDELASWVIPAQVSATPGIPGIRILRELGRGGFGVVYEAIQESLGRRVAIKLLAPGRTADTAILARFRREARALAALRHPGLVSVHEVGETGGVPFLVLELVEGLPLSEAISLTRRGEDGGLPAGGAARRRFLLPRFAVLAEALAHVHDRGVVHRDVKPSNVILTPDGALRLVDFGLALTTFDEDRNTQSGQAVGTPATMAPEQARGLRDVGPAADVYGLGATLYEAVTLTPAYEGGGFAETLARVLAGPPRPPRSLDPGIPPDLEAVILTAMAYDAKDRYRDAGAFAADLTAVAEGRSPHARPPGLWRRARAWSHRRPLLAVALILGPPLVGAAVWAAAELREAARRSSRIELAQEVRRLSRDVFRLPALQEAGVEDTAALLERVRALLERDPAHVQLLFLQTWLEAKSGRPDDALAAFERHPSFRDSVEGRTLCAFLRRTTEAADADLAEIVGAGPIPAESRYLVAVILLEWDPLAARARIDIGLQDRDLDPFVRCTFLLFRGLVRTRLGDLEGAEEDFAAGSSLDPEDASALAGRWSLARRLRGAEAAAPLRERLHAWIRGDPFRAPDAAMVVVSLEDPDAGREFLGTRPPENPKLGLRWDLARIRCAARPVPTDDDVAAADEARRRHPGTAVIHHEAGHLYGAARDSDRVCEAFDRAAALDPGNPSPWICRASELLRCAGSEAALTALEEARRRGGSERLIATYEVFIHSHSNDPAAALPRIDALLAQGIDTGMIRLNQGVALVRLGRAPEAVDAFERARARLPGDAAVVAGLAIALCSAGEPTKAVEVCDAALTRGIAGAKVPEAKAQALLQLGRPAEALIAAEDAIRREPRSAGAHYFRSGLLRELGRRDEAIDTYVRSFALPVTDMTSALVAARSFHALDPERAGPVLRDTFLPLARRSRLPPSDRRPLALFLDRVLGEEEAAAALDPGAVGR